MIQLFTDVLVTWNRESNERIKLQRVFFSLALLTATVAGLVSLVNLSIGSNLIILSAFLASVYITNAVIWALTEAFVVRKINNLPQKTKTKK